MFNYLYFALLFILITAVHLFHVAVIEPGSVWERCIYSVDALGQCAIEVAVLALTSAWAIQRRVVWLHRTVIGVSLLLLMMHLIDFPLVRIMDMSIWYSLDFVLAETIENFIQMLKASNVSLSSWALFACSVGLFGALSWWGVRGLEKLSFRRPISVQLYPAIRTVAITLICLVALDATLTPWRHPQREELFTKALPWKRTFALHAFPSIPIQQHRAPNRTQSWYEQKLSTLQIQQHHLPNIYLFITESLREDFISPDIAPHLVSFRQETLPTPSGIAAANATHLSWFSIFHSESPLLWGERQPHQWTLGSLPLQILKKAGYTLHVLSASRFRYYQMDTLLFSKDASLIDHYDVFPDQVNQENHAYDSQCFDTLLQQMHKAPNGHLFLVFLEGTHFDYSWPPSLQLPHFPPSNGIDYFQASYSRTHVEGIKNRYRHAIHHIDHQFGRFLAALKEHPEQDDALIVFTGDHGEEFYEEDRLFHASNLNTFQTSVPIYYKLGRRSGLATSAPLSTHEAIFPTLLDHLFGPETPWNSWWAGRSLLQSNPQSMAITARYNASRTPYELLITTPEERLIVRLKGEQYKVEVVSRKTLEGIDLPMHRNSLEMLYSQKLGTVMAHP